MSVKGKSSRAIPIPGRSVYQLSITIIHIAANMQDGIDSPHCSFVSLRSIFNISYVTYAVILIQRMLNIGNA